MAELVQLDRAAALVGKSEVTLRRLIKAGKIPFQKEKTLTGFIYMVDPEQVRTFYYGREGMIAEESAAMDSSSEGGSSTSSSNQQGEIPISRPQSIRVAVAGETGSAHEYWQKKADMYEERYNQEVVKHSQAREELGVWRGRAEQAQNMLIKLLPSGQDLENAPAPAPVAHKGEGTSVMIVLMTVLIILTLAAVGVLVYLRLTA